MKPHLRWRLRRLGCVLNGCDPSNDFPGCERCGTSLYDDTALYVEQPCRVVRWYWSLRYRLACLWKRATGRRTCATCGKKYRWGGLWAGSEGYGYRRDWCSEACREAFVPF